VEVKRESTKFNAGPVEANGRDNKNDPIRITLIKLNVTKDCGLKLEKENLYRFFIYRIISRQQIVKHYELAKSPLKKPIESIWDYGPFWRSGKYNHLFLSISTACAIVASVIFSPPSILAISSIRSFLFNGVNTVFVLPSATCFDILKW